MKNAPENAAAAESVVTRRGEFWKGVLVVFPIQAGVFPFAMITGIAAVEVGLTASEAMAMSVIVFAGASQIVMLQLLAAGAPLFITILSGFIVNMRFMMYSASIAPYFRQLRRCIRWFLAYILTDQIYAVSIVRYVEHPDRPHKHWFFFGGASWLWVVWQAGTALGIALGRGIPESWGLDFVFPLMFMALAVPALRDGPAIVAATVAGGVSLAGEALPLNVGLMVAAFSGIAAGMFTEARST